MFILWSIPAAWIIPVYMSVSVQFQDAGIEYELCRDSVSPGSGKYVLHNVITCTYVNEIYFSL